MQTALLGTSSGRNGGAPAAHASTHQAGGSDEINVGALSGELADAQPIAVTKNSGAVIGTRAQLNFIEGANITLTIADDGPGGEVDITIAAAGAAGDITAVGDVASGDAFTGTAGTTLTFFNAGGNATFAYDGAKFDLSKTLAVAGDLTCTGEAQLGNANTDNHGFNTAPVAQRGITGDFAETVTVGESFGLHLTTDHQGVVPVASTKELHGIYLNPLLSGTQDQGFISHTTAGIEVDIDDTSTYNNGSGTVDQYGFFSQFVVAPTVTNISVYRRACFYGLNTNHMGTTGTTAKYGGRMDVSGTADDNFGYYATVSGATANWFFYNDGAADNFLGEDNAKTYGGTGKDWSLTFNGTNVVLKPDEVGSGIFQVDGEAQLGTANTDNHGINTAPVANQGLTASFSESAVTGYTYGYKITSAHTGNVADFDSKWMHGLALNVQHTGSQTGNAWNSAYGIHLDVDDSQTYNSAGHTMYNQGIWLDMSGTPTVTNLQYYWQWAIRTSDTTNLGTTGNTSKWGVESTVTGTADVNYGVWAFANGATTNWGFYNNGGDVMLGVDNWKTKWGIAFDAEMYYDGTDLVINPQAVGSGGLKLVDGDLFFTGDGSGLTYGSCYGNHIGWSQANAVQNTWYNISDADMATGELNDVTHDGNGKLTVGKAGRYLIEYTICWENDTVNDHIETGIEVSGSGSANAAGQGHLETKFANQEEHLSGVAILDLAASATIEVAIRTTDNNTPTISVQGVNLSVTQIGGT